MPQPELLLEAPVDHHDHVVYGRRVEKALQDALHHRPAAHRKERLGPVPGEGIEAGAETGGEDDPLHELRNQRTNSRTPSRNSQVGS